VSRSVREVTLATSLVKPVALPLAAKVGDTVRATPAKWSGTVTRGYQWYLAGKAIKGATKNSLKITGKMLGKKIAVEETAKFKSGKTLKSKSTSFTVGQLGIASPATISFTDATAGAVSAGTVASSPAGTIANYEWFVDGVSQPNAKLANFIVGPNHESKTITVAVTMSKAGWSSVTSTSRGFVVPVKGASTNVLLWSQDFNEASNSSVDPETWNTSIGDGSNDLSGSGWGNGEFETYVESAVRTDGDNLVITANRNSDPNLTCNFPTRGTCQWASGKIETLGKVGFKYGRLEARIKISSGTGVWPAFWMLGANRNEVDWPLCGEIDIAEWRGDNMNSVAQTLHMPGHFGGGGLTSSVELSSPADSNFHDYAVEWSQNRITWFVDGQTAQTLTRDDAGSFKWPFNDEMYLLFNLAIGGNFVSNTVDPNLNSASMKVDWVKYYSVNGLGSLVSHP
jgi:beta-glucanase (GH16 family)